MTYQECVDYILSVPLFATKLGTDNLNQILDIMGHPEKEYPVIHVAGTNGKGSTCSFLASVLKQAGKKVGVFTSPHLVKINERLRISEQIISDEEFERDCNVDTTPKGLKNSQAKGSSLDETLENNGVPTKQLFILI